MPTTSTSVRECTWCGTQFRPTRDMPNKSYCSDGCRLRMRTVAVARSTATRRDMGVMERERARDVGDVLAGIAHQEAPVLPTRPGSCPRCRSRLLTYTNSPTRRGIGEARCTTCGHEVDYRRV